ncbi:hypothetical protein AOQ71_10255 [Bradyrhizobium manausense]|uniref:Uncharacterized protein n=2 Tax=Bradyrhizobium manausense TaxID=989370 RepID=A0A0R3E4L5_9BRAD|nr:hypothetical protein AOQ71_10255 [Bradyrhizobium manausense]
MEADMISPQNVIWGPREGRDPGIRVLQDEVEAKFIPWIDLERELRDRLMPQLFVDPSGFTFVTRDYHGKSNWLVQLMDEDGEWYCDVWFGVNPDNGWAVDGMVHFGEADEEPHVWQSYQRYSDGTYRRLPSWASSLDEYKRREGKPTSQR